MAGGLVIVDYGMGNLRSVRRAFELAGAAPTVTGDPAEVEKAGAIVLPGVGAFGACVANLDRLGLREVLIRKVSSGTPFLGICLGYQVLFQGSEESPGAPGLTLLPGKVVRFAPVGEEVGKLRVPHMGWNRVWQRAPSPLWEGIANGSFFYFVHSYYVEAGNPGMVAATTDYGTSFASAVLLNKAFACQFHPEKSQQSGLLLVKNFVRFSGL